MESSAVAPSRAPDGRLTIGLVAANLHRGVGATLWSAVLAAAERHDVNLIGFPGGEVRATEQPPNSIYDLVGPDVLDGLICWASALELQVARFGGSRLAERFSKLPLVSLNTAIGDDDPLVLDSYRGMCAAVEHLIRVHQRTKIAFLPGTVANPGTHERYQAYTDMLARHRLPVDRRLISAPVDSRAEAGASAMCALLDARGLRPGDDFDAVVACSDLLAVEALTVLAQRGIKVPEEVSVVGFNDSPEARLADPPLTSVSMPFGEFGDLAVETLLHRLTGTSPCDRPKPPSTLVIRNSCGCSGGELLEADDNPAAGGLERLPPLPRELLLATFAAAAKGETGGFASEIHRLLRTWATSSNDADAWAAATLALGSHVVPGLNESQRRLAERLVSQAQLIVAESTRSLLEDEHRQSNQLAQGLRDLATDLLSVVDTRALAKALDRHLPLLGIPSWHLSLEPSTELATHAVLPTGYRYSMVAEPLYLRDEHLGYALFEVGPGDGSVYRALGDQLSHALQQIKLFQQLEDARDVAQQANQLKTTLLGSISEVLRAPAEDVLRQVAVARELLDLQYLEIDTGSLAPVLLDPGTVLSEAFGVSPLDRLPLIKADPDRLRQALLALRYGAEQSVGVDRRLRVEAEVEPPFLRVRLVLHHPNPRRSLTLGAELELGLPIAERLIALQNGSLRCRETPIGAEIEIDLPLPTPSGDVGHRAGGRLMCVGTVQEATELGLRLGLTVSEFQAGTEEASTPAAPWPAAVAFDLAGERTENWSVIRHLHDHPRLQTTPFLVYGPGDGVSKRLTELIVTARPVGAAAPILIVASAPQLREYYVRLLGRILPGHPVVTAADGMTALSALAQEPPSLLVLTKLLPDMDAFDLLDRLPSRHRVGEVPAIVLTAAAISSRDVQRAEPHLRTILLGNDLLSETETVDLLTRLLAASGRPSRNGRRVQRAVAYLHQRFQHPITRRQVADAAGLSEDHLSRIFHQEVGVSPWEYLNRLRVLQAKEYLRDSDDSIQFIARRVGFRDRSYFSRTFRKLTGKSPQGFRNHCLFEH